MKRIIAGWLLLALPIFAFAQTNSIATFYDKYMKYDEVTNVDLSGGILKLLSNGQEGAAGDILSRIT
ncbi:MAG: hypothetical protein AAFP19_20455, partial [Bacteroidota bacterium]